MLKSCVCAVFLLGAATVMPISAIAAPLAPQRAPRVSSLVPPSAGVGRPCAITFGLPLGWRGRAWEYGAQAGPRPGRKPTGKQVSMPRQQAVKMARTSAARSVEEIADMLAPLPFFARVDR